MADTPNLHPLNPYFEGQPGLRKSVANGDE